MKIFTVNSFKQMAALLPLVVPLVASAAPGVQFFDPRLGAKAKLSEVQIYTDINAKTTDTALKYFEVNSALWSDAAHKDRWIILPPGKHITYVDTTDTFVYPDSTIFVKLFRHDTTAGDSSSRIYWETRLLVKLSGNNTNWYGFSYKWNKGATEATLVSTTVGFDTLLFLSGAPHYRKWHFPSQEECDKCHRVHDGARGVLGFWPAQLKRPTKNGTSNQVKDLFAAGVFTGSQPGDAALAKRFRGISEPIPSGLSAAERFKVIDTMARSYIAANCSGCHGNKGLEDGATEHAIALNYDFYNLKPMMEFGFKETGSFGLDLSDKDLYIGDTAIRPSGRYQFLLTLQEWGINTASNQTFDMVRPPASAFPANFTASPYLVTRGYASYSTLLFRQSARKTPAFDSIDTFQELGADPQLMKRWLFKAKWGSKAWRDSLAKHTVPLNQILSAARYERDGSQMPPLATYIPDTAALKILGEWVHNYYTLTVVPGNPPPVLSVHGARLALQGTPRIQNRQLIVPEGWTGKVVMIGLDGRSTPLASVGRGRYALPASLPSGVYFFQVGSRSFRTSVLK